jgi:hypothetical protein
MSRGWKQAKDEVQGDDIYSNWGKEGVPRRRIVILDFARLCSPADIGMDSGKPRRPSGS